MSTTNTNTQVMFKQIIVTVHQNVDSRYTGSSELLIKVSADDLYYAEESRVLDAIKMYIDHMNEGVDESEQFQYGSHRIIDPVEVDSELFTKFLFS